MTRGWWLFYVTTMLSVWNAGIVWFTQIAVYPLWPLVGRDGFHDYHLAWWHGMWPSFGPVILMFVCSLLLLKMRPMGVSTSLLWVGIALQVAVHAMTAFFWAPLQASMATPDGLSLVKYDELMNTHWLRVSFFLVYAGLMLWILGRYLSQSRGREV